jgi:hypothetical protein
LLRRFAPRNDGWNEMSPFGPPLESFPKLFGRRSLI